MVDTLFAIDARSLLLLRVGLGSLLLADLWTRARNLRAHYTDAGVYPRAAAAEALRLRPGGWSLHLAGGSLGFAVLTFGVAAIFAVMLVVGYRVHLAAAASWVLLVSLHRRLPVVLNGSDALLRMVLFWSIFLPFGRESTQLRIVSIASAALLIQVAMLYFVAGYSKLNPVWFRGDGLLHALSNFGSPLGRPLLKWPLLLRVTSKAVPWLEIAGAVLLFSPVATQEVRLVVVLFFMAFHAGIGLFMQNLGLFPLTCMLTWATFLPTIGWDRAASLPIFTSPGVASTLGAIIGVPSRVAAVAAPPFASTPFFVGLTMLVVAYLTFGNLDLLRASLRGRRGRPVFAALDRIANAGMLRHNWKFFGSPTNKVAWFIFQINLEDGRSVDMLTGNSPVIDAVSAQRAEMALVTNRHWWDYFRSLARPQASHVKYALAYYERVWNASHPVAQRATSVVAHLGIQSTYPVSSITWRECRSGGGLDALAEHARRKSAERAARFRA